MTDKYGHLQPREGMKDMIPPFNFFRNNTSPQEIKQFSKFPLFDLFAAIEKKDDCSESCEPFK